MLRAAGQRTVKDYAYISTNTDHRGASDPGSYSVSCKHERMKALLRTGLESYNAEMARIAKERERQAKDAALQVVGMLQPETTCTKKCKTGHVWCVRRYTVL